MGDTEIVHGQNDLGLDDLLQIVSNSGVLCGTFGIFYNSPIHSSFRVLGYFRTRGIIKTVQVLVLKTADYCTDKLVLITNLNLWVVILHLKDLFLVT